tara:strand:- start:967 stop:1917 length:951 start_codon:yes stop_codon:yes gene_type:complete
MTAKLLESWRPFIAEARDFDLETKSSEPIRLDMSTLMRQGAVDIDDYHSPLNSDKDPLFAETDLTKRGWFFDIAITSKPKNGEVIYDEHRRGFIYTSRSDYVGEDCFNYILTNGKQISNTGKVIVNVLENYKLLLTVEKDSNDRYRVTAKVTSPEDAEPISKVSYYWNSLGPYLNEGRVVLGSKRFFNTRITGNRYSGYYVLDPGNRWGFGDPIHDSDFATYIDSRTGTLFQPLDRYNDIEVVAYLRLSGKNWYEPYDVVLRARLSDFYGMPWEDSGKLRDPNTPDKDKLEGKYEPDFMEEVPSQLFDKTLVPDVR